MHLPAKKKALPRAKTDVLLVPPERQCFEPTGAAGFLQIWVEQNAKNHLGVAIHQMDSSASLLYHPGIVMDVPFF